MSYDHANGLTVEQQKEVERIAELQVRRYFDHYLANVFPRQVARLERDIDVKIQAHDDSPMAHGRVERLVNRTLWMAMGVAVAAGAGGAELLRVLLHF